MVNYAIIYILFGYIVVSSLRENKNTSLSRWVILILLWPIILLAMGILWFYFKCTGQIK